MAGTLVMGVDCGTQSLRAALYQTDGVLLGRAAATYETVRPHTNWAEQNPEDWWDALTYAVRACVKEAGVASGDVAALACDGTSFTGVFCDAQGIPLRPAIIWMDLRAAEEARRIERLAHPVFDYCGRHISPEWMLPKTLWVREHEPAVYAASDRIVEGVDWLIYRLTGRWVTSNSNASGKRHWTPERGWPVDLYEAAGLPELAEKSPDKIVYMGDPVGQMTRQAADALGLSTACVVSHGGMDGWTAPIGKNCFAKGCRSLALGTSTVLFVETDAPRFVDGVMGPFPDGIRRGYAVYEAGQTSGGATISWLAALLGREAPGEHERLEQEAALLPPGAQGLVVFDGFRGNRTPYFDPQARGAICGLTLDHTPAHLYRAVVEACSFAVRNVAERFERGGLPIDCIRTCGSGAANRLWTQTLADVLGKTIEVSAEKHATCLGSAVCAAVACGAFADLPEAAAAMAPRFTAVEPALPREAYDSFYEAYLETYERMKDVMHRMAHIQEHATGDA
jgi:ribulokinase